MSVFDKEKALIVNDFSKQSSLVEQTLLCKNLCSAARSIFALFIKSTQKRQEEGLWDGYDNAKLAHDFNFLLIASCSANNLVRELASSFMKTLDEFFPHLIHQPGVLDNTLDVVSALYEQLNSAYDGKGHRLNLLL